MWMCAERAICGSSVIDHSSWILEGAALAVWVLPGERCVESLTWLSIPLIVSTCGQERAVQGQGGAYYAVASALASHHHRLGRNNLFTLGRMLVKLDPTDILVGEFLSGSPWI